MTRTLVDVSKIHRHEQGIPPAAHPQVVKKKRHKPPLGKPGAGNHHGQESGLHHQTARLATWFKEYLTHPVNQKTTAITAGRAGVSTVMAWARYTPLVGRLLNAGYALAGVVSATVQTRAYLDGDPEVPKGNVWAAWGQTGADLARVVSPSLTDLWLAGSAAVMAYYSKQVLGEIMTQPGTPKAPGGDGVITLKAPQPPLVPKEYAPAHALRFPKLMKHQRGG